MATTVFNIPSMDCPAEEAVIRSKLGSMNGIDGLEFDLFNRRLTVEHSLDGDETIIAALDAVGMKVVTQIGSDERRTESPPVAARTKVIRLVASGLLAFGSEVVAWKTKDEQSIAVVIPAVSAILVGGLPTLEKGWIALRTLTLNINFLMTVAVIGAAAIGEWPEAAMVIFLFAVAELIESYSLERARNAVRSLMAMTPETALLKTLDDSWRLVPASGVAVGSSVRVKPGERVALDGVVTSGASAVDQSPITGESMPVEKTVGDSLFAGTINGNGLLEFRTTAAKDDAMLARIVRTVQEAQGQRAPTQRFVDAFARVYTPIMCALALLVAVLPPLFWHQTWMPWIYKALVLLVVSCPCALVISTPVTIVSGLAAAARRGILIKGGVYLEQGKRIRMVALDKTGTITEGRLSVRDVRALGALSANDVLRLTASLDAGSDHPIARAVSAAWSAEKSAAFGPLLRVEKLTAIPGKGVSGLIDGEPLFVGNHRFAHELGVCSPTIEVAFREIEAKGQTAIVLTDRTAALGLLAVADNARASSIEAIRTLHEMGVRTVMLSGDNQTTAEVIGKAVGIDDVRGDLLPDDKLHAIDELLIRFGAVAMVGDGVNDAPALARATIGFAMGAAGADAALETADVALMGDDLRGLPEFLTLSRRTTIILVQNISLALTAKSIFFVLSIFGSATMWMAVLADMGASLLVVANGLRVLAQSPPVART